MNKSIQKIFSRTTFRWKKGELRYEKISETESSKPNKPTNLESSKEKHASPSAQEQSNKKSVPAGIIATLIIVAVIISLVLACLLVNPNGFTQFCITVGAFMQTVKAFLSAIFE